MNNRCIAATKDWFAILWHSIFVSQLFIPYTGTLMKLASSTGSNPNMKAIPKLLPCRFPKTLSKLFNLFIYFIQYALTKSFLCV